MKSIHVLAQYYVDLIVKLGLVRFSLLLASILMLLAIVAQVGVTLLFHGTIVWRDVLRSLVLALLMTPWTVYFLSVVVKQLDDSRQRLSRLVDKLKEMNHRDLQLNRQLQSNIEQLNREIAQREKVERLHTQAIQELQIEVAQRKQTQTELSQQSVLLRSFLDVSPDLVYYRNEQGEFSGCNRAMELLVGKSEKELMGLTPRNVFAPDIAEKIMETDEKVFVHNVSLTYEQWLVYPDGRKACYELRKVPFYCGEGKRCGLVSFGRDITERKRYQDALESASRDKTVFISTISHELRTPLNGIVGLSRILLDTKLQPEQLKYLKTIHTSAVALGNIFNDIIEMDRLERRKVQIDRQPTDLIAFLGDLENLAGLLAEPKKLNFSLQLDGAVPPKLQIDGTRLRQVLWNLISNAVKFTREGGIVIRVSYQPDNHLCFAVQDSGIGIPVDEQDRIFAMYYQAIEQNGRNSVSGTGIGLAISKRLAQAMGGDITVESEPGKGSCFTLRITAPVVEKASESGPSEETTLPSLHILLVEDIELNVIVARSILEKWGHTIDVAMTGHEALQLFRPENYDLVLLDIHLPDITGFDVVNQIRRQYAGQHLPPLIALTANVLRKKEEYLQAGMDDVLSKPISVPALMAVIQRYWDKPAATIELPQCTVDAQSVLDTETLEQYIHLMDSKMIQQNVDLFVKMMPGYLALLDSNMIARDQKGIVEEAHKIKGAAGAVGLKHLQQLAQQIQTPSLPAWWDNIQEWVDELKAEWLDDVKTLREWLSQCEKS